MKKLFSIMLSAAIIITAALFIAKEALAEEMEIYEKTLRLHVPANSDSPEDQAVKIKVRDAVIEYLEAPLSECKTRDEAAQIVQSLSTEITKEANKILKDEGFSYTAKVLLTEEHYPKRDYGGVSLPAGRYTSLKIELGSGDGQNWWCVLFPQVCLGTAKADEAMSQVGFTPEQIKLLTESEDHGYAVKFKLLEIISSIFK